MNQNAPQISNVDEHVDERSIRVPTDGPGGIRRTPTDGPGGIRHMPTDGPGGIR